MTSDERAGPPPADSIARNAAYSLAVQIVTSASAAALTLFLVRALGAEDYGVLALALAVGILLFVLADVGISPATARFVAENRGDNAGTARVVASALWLKVLISGAVSVALLALAGPIASAYGHSELTWPLRAVAVAMFGQGVMALVGGAFIAQGRTALNLGLVGSTGAVELSATIGFVLLGGGVTGAACGRALGYAVGATVALVLGARALGASILRPGSRDAPATRSIARYAGVLVVVDGAVIVLDQIDAILVGAFLTTAAVGQFQAPLRLATFLLYPGYAVANGVAPRLARHATEQPRVEAFASSLRLLLIFQAALVPPLLVWATPIAELLFGSSFPESDDVLRALVPFVFLSGFAPLVSLGANYLGRGARRVPIAIGALAVNAAVALALIPTIGVVGAAVATGVAYVVYVPAHLAICVRTLGISLRPLALTLARCLVASALAAGGLFVFGTSELEALEALAGAALAIAVYVGALTALRELSRADLRWLTRVRRGAVEVESS